MTFYVYILHCSDGSYYTGHTDNLEARLVSHDTGAFAGYTLTRRPVKLAFAESFPTREDAFARERQLKGWSRAKKEALIRGDWNRLVELAKSKKQSGQTCALRQAKGERVYQTGLANNR